MRNDPRPAAPSGARRASPSVVNVGYSSTNYWVVSSGEARLLVDLGFPGTIGKLRANLHRIDVPLGEIRYAIATHYHIDHAGCAQDLKRLGVPLLVLESQTSAISLMTRHVKPGDNYTEITPDGNVVISFAQSREMLGRVGIAGEILPTPGHSDDSVSLVLDDGAAFIGDLTFPAMATDEQREVVLASWRLLEQHGARRVYPGHGRIVEFAQLSIG